MTTNIYIVVGERGEYDDRCQWNEAGFSTSEAAHAHIARLKAFAEQFKAWRQLRDDFYKIWDATNPQPKYPTHLMIKEQKFPGRAQEITQAMRDERKATREHNQAVSKAHGEANGIWYGKKIAAAQALLEQNEIDAESINKLLHRMSYDYDDTRYEVEVLEVEGLD